MFVLLALLLSAGSGAALAQVTPPPPGDSRSLNPPGWDDPVKKWTDADLERLVEMAINEQITVSETRVIVEQMTEKQITKVAELLAIRAGVRDEWQQSRDESRESNEKETSCLSRSYTWGCYPVEYWHRVPYYKNADWYHSSKECNSADADWIFYYYIYYANDPNGLRWKTNSSRVYLAFLAYGLDLNSFAYSWSEVRLVAGKTATSMAGGPDWVGDHLYLYGGF